MPIELEVNGAALEAPDADGDMPLLWYLREVLHLRGTKFGCGIGQCGACTVHVDGSATRSCVLPLSSAQGTSITTIEGLARGETLHPVQQAWLDVDVAQCGYCQPGQIMAAVALLAQNAQPTDEDIERQMSNLCRCGTYVRIRQAIKEAASRMTSREDSIA